MQIMSSLIFLITFFALAAPISSLSIPREPDSDPDEMQFPGVDQSSAGSGAPIFNDGAADGAERYVLESYLRLINC